LDILGSISNDIKVSARSINFINVVDTNFSESLEINSEGNKNSEITIRDDGTFSNQNGSVNVHQPHLLKFLVDGIGVNKINLNKVSTVNSLYVSNTKILEELDLAGVKISKLSFNILDISRADFKIHRTEFEDLKLINVKWPQENRAYELEDLSRNYDVDDYIFQLKNLKESYRELKVHFISRHNFFDAMLFATNELRIEEKIKSAETWRFQSLSTFWKNFGDWFVLWSNKKFSNFGLSWQRPLFWWLLVFHLIPFYLIVSFADNIGIVPFVDVRNLQIHSIDLNATSEGLKLYLKLLFPIHDNIVTIYLGQKVYKQDLWQGALGFLDFMLRVFAPYFIFLFIRGTRKFNFKVG
ncbi:MAG: hypothetical protein AB7O48_19135, partial [Cyclobacteriaceae bacterium]